MLLPRHPRLMSNDELCDFISSLIERRAPESNSLDYKAEVSINSTPQKIEIGKDISSFANENGGILLYGVPEEEENGVPVPKTLSECGIEISKNLPENIENILIDIVTPPLTDLEIRVLNSKSFTSNPLLMIYHPESWNKPHMVEGYKYARYYRRGNFRAIIMTERQVEAAYLTRKISLEHANNFFETGDFRAVPNNCPLFRAILCPRFSLNRREEMLEERFRNWLNSNHPAERPGEWIPFLDGWSFRGYPNGNFHGKQYEFRFFHNGGLCFNLDLDYVMMEHQEQKHLNLTMMKKVFEDTIFPYAEKAYEFLRVSGPLSIQINLYNVKKLKALIPLVNALDEFYIGPTSLERDSIDFVEEMNISDFSSSPDKIVTRLIDRLASAFGMYEKRRP